MPDVVLFSNSTAAGRGFLEHALPLLATILPSGARVLFLAYGSSDPERYARVMADALAPLGIELVPGLPQRSVRRELDRADALFVGGGNAFRLLDRLETLGLLPLIRQRVVDGMPHLGASAGANVACPTIRTTNDMPIVEPRSLAALGLVPFQVNPHYVESDERDRRIAQFLEENDVPVVGLREGSWLHVRGDQAVVGGAAGVRVFGRQRPTVDRRPGADLSGLLASTPRFDVQ